MALNEIYLSPGFYPLLLLLLRSGSETLEVILVLGFGVGRSVHFGLLALSDLSQSALQFRVGCSLLFSNLLGHGHS